MEEVAQMAVWKFKSCPRCQGDVCLGKDFDGWYEECLQCSYKRILKTIDEFKETSVDIGDKKSPIVR